MKGRAIPYSADDLAWLEENRDWPRPMLHRIFVMLFDRRDVSADALKALMTRKGWTTGRSGQFVKGQEPPNKGRKGYCPPGCEKGWFRKGERSGVATKLWKPVGSERIVDGYLERKINDDLPLRNRWRAVHILNWEAINGPLPEGHCLKCLDGNRLNTDPSNWKLVHRGVLARLNGGRHKKRLSYDEAPPELKPSVMAAAELAHAARKARERKAA